MNLNRKVGFLLGGYFYSNSGRGHESNARGIIREMGWLEDWLGSHHDAQDYLVLERGAIQLGSGIFSKRIIASKNFYNERTLDKIAEEYGLEGYKYDLIR